MDTRHDVVLQLGGWSREVKTSHCKGGGGATTLRSVAQNAVDMKKVGDWI